jgi:drug/metabolite transporter (DMT)-like permease
VSSSVSAALSGIAGMTFVGGSIAVSGALADAPLYTAQALRYGVACALLVGYMQLTGRRLRLPRGVEWLWLLGVSVSGLLVFNIALVSLWHVCRWSWPRWARCWRDTFPALAFSWRPEW